MNELDIIEKILIKDINAFCERHGGMSVTTFGRLALNDPTFYNDLLSGRSPTGKVERKLREWMRKQNRKLRSRK